MEKSANGWPASANPSEINIQQFPVTGTNIKLRCAADCGKILAAFAADFHAQVEPINEGSLDDWGYAYRPVRGQKEVLSNHASGTAIDLNSTKHPLGKQNTFKPTQIVVIRQLIQKYHLRWGGDYKGRKDDMHFEITENADQVKELTKQLNL